jgi:glycosyltransferase involved in cell wall biosynthesis
MTVGPETQSSRARWIVAAPFADSTEIGWLPAEAERLGPRFGVIPARYDHDRSRESTSGRQWLDYMGHALAAWRDTGWRAGRNAGLVTWFPQLALCVGLLKRITFSRRPVLAWCFNLGQTHGGWRRTLTRFALSRVDAIVVHSRSEIETYARWLDFPRDRFIFAPLAVAGPEHAEIAQDEPFVLAMGSACRDYPVFVEAMGQLGYPTVIVAGEHALAGIDLPANMERRSGLTIAQCHDLAHRARVNVVPIDNPSTASGQVTVIEAMMLGRGVVATRCAGTEDYVVDGGTGLLVPPGDRKALAAAIERMWSDNGLRRRLGKAALRHAREHFTFAAVAPQLARILADIEKVHTRREERPTPQMRRGTRPSSRSP